MTPTQFSFAFSINAVAFIGMAQTTGWLGRRFGLRRVVRAAITFFVVTTGLLLAATLAGLDNAYALIAMLFVSFSSMGLVIPSSAVLALENHGPRAGTASAFMGTLQIVAAMAVVSVLGAVSNGAVLLPMVGAIFGCAVVAFALSLVALNGGEAVPEPAE